jgi:adenylate cyclase
MNELSALRVHLDRVLQIGLAWLLAGLLSALFEYNAVQRAGVESALFDHIDANYLRSLLAGLIGGGVYIFLLRPRLRRRPFFQAWGIMALLILVVLSITVALWRARLSPDLGPAFASELFTLDVLGTYLYWTLLMGGTMLMVRMNDQYGSGGIAYLTGRYHKPRQEMRIFMFLDMRSSTAIAEQLGHVKYFQLLNELFTDITDVIVRSRGEIYQYVGDEVSVSWTFRNGVRRQRCVRCFLDIRAKLNRRARHYEGRYGIVPVFKAGFHYGPVTTGEVGSVKRERIYSGDVVNTAARIQNSCNELAVDNLLSQELLEVLHLPPVYRTREMGSIALRGKASSTTLWTIDEARV